MSDTDLIVLMGVGDFLKPPFRLRFARPYHRDKAMMVVCDVGLLRFVHLANMSVDGVCVKMFTAEGKNFNFDLNDPRSFDAIVNCVVKISTHKSQVETEYV
jgi:hypothetical protein